MQENLLFDDIIIETLDMIHNKAGLVNDIDNISGESVEHVNEI